MIGRWIVCGLGVAVLAGMIAERELGHARPESAEGYQQKARDAADKLPLILGDWVVCKPKEKDAGMDKAMQEAAERLLRPNVYISRSYQNTRTLRIVGLVVVQCKDVRDMLGHYPMNCYPAHGETLWVPDPKKPDQTWTKTNPKQEDIDLGEVVEVQGTAEAGKASKPLKLHGTMYRFSMSNEPTRDVFNFMILPNGTTERTMDALYTAARWNRPLRYFGAGQIQVITDVGMLEEERKEMITMLLNGVRPVIDAILEGAK